MNMRFHLLPKLNKFNLYLIKINQILTSSFNQYSIFIVRFKSNCIWPSIVDGLKSKSLTIWFVGPNPLSLAYTDIFNWANPTSPLHYAIYEQQPLRRRDKSVAKNWIFDCCKQFLNPLQHPSIHSPTHPSIHPSSIHPVPEFFAQKGSNCPFTVFICSYFVQVVFHKFFN